MSNCKGCTSHRNNIADARRDVVQALRRMERTQTESNRSLLGTARENLAQRKADAATHQATHETGNAQ